MAAKAALGPQTASPPIAVAAASDVWPAGVEPTPEYAAALQFLREDGGHLFVTGRAGTGKSTLLRALGTLLHDEMVILAPTGLAAVNVGGQTIHSFFGFPPRLIRPDDIRRSRNGRVMRMLKVLVIDEVSMVRSDLMWAIDQSLRVNRGVRASRSAACACCCSATCTSFRPSCRRPRWPSTWSRATAGRSSSVCRPCVRAPAPRCSSSRTSSASATRPCSPCSTACAMERRMPMISLSSTSGFPPSARFRKASPMSS